MCISLAAIAPPAPAQDSSSTVYDHLNKYEQMLFGQTTAGGAVDKRLSALEKSVFGKAQKGSTAERLAGIERMMGGASQSQGGYLPPIPPSLDRSQFNQEPVMAPDAVTAKTHQADPEDVRPAASGDKVKGMLKEAMDLYSQGKAQDAERVYQKVLAIDFRNGDANYNLGAIAEEQGRLKESAGYYRAALAATPGDSELREALSQVEKKLTAANAPKQAPLSPFSEVSSQPALAKIANDAASAYKNAHFDEAISKLNYLVRQTPYDASVQFALGQAYRGKGDNREALKHLRAAATLDPKNDLYTSTAAQAEKMPLDEQPQVTAKNDNRPSGELTPFNLPSEGRRSGSIDDLADLDLSGMGGLNELANLNSLFFGARRGTIDRAPIGSAQAWDMNFGMGMPVGMMASPGSLRLRRAVQAGLAGAAMGAMNNRGMPGGSRRGAMRGAMYGSMYGLLGN